MAFIASGGGKKPDLIIPVNHILGLGISSNAIILPSINTKQIVVNTPQVVKRCVAKNIGITGDLGTFPPPPSTPITGSKTVPVTPPSDNQIPLKKEIILEKKQLSINEDVFAIGKRKVVIDNGSFGPTLADRKVGVNLTPDGTEIKDYFRFVTGRYWTTSDDGKTLIFLNQKVSGTPWNVRDFNYTKDSSLQLTDQHVSESNGNVSTNNIGSIKNYAFSTNQWMLIQANSPFNVFTQLGKILTSVKNLSNSSLSPTTYQTKISINDLTFNQTSFAQSIGAQTTPSNKTVTMNFKSSLDTRLNQVSPSLGIAISKQIAAPAPKISTPNIYTVVPKPIPPAPPKELLNPAIKTEVDFFDHSFEMPLPFSSKELKKYNGLIKPLISNIEPNYNFMIDKYEQVSNNVNISERVLPNMYVLMSEIMLGTNNQDFVNHLTLNGDITMADTPAPRNSSFMDKQNNLLKKFSGDYFELFSRDLDTIYNEISDIAFDKKNRLEILSNKFLDIIIPENNLDLVKNFNDKKYIFPMYVELQFSTDTTTIMTDLLKKSKFTSLFERKIINDVLANIAEQNNLLEASELIEQSKTEFVKKYSFEKTTRRFWDITTLIESEVNNSDFTLWLGDSNTEQVLSSDNQNNNFIKNLFTIIFIGKLRTIMKQKMRTFEEMMSGKLAYSETILYRIEKAEVNSNGSIGKLVQNYLVPNYNEIELFDFIDTQVKYNKKYSYRVYAYQAVIGTKYNYSDIKAQNKFATVKVTQYPSVRIVEVSYFEYITQVVDNPPVFPEVEFVPYKGINNKVSFLLRANTGEYVTDPILIEQTDKQSFDQIRLANDLEETDPIRFKTDDHSGVFQVFRLDRKPDKYQDFAGSLMAAVETDVSKITLQSATSATYIDSIEPNKKYYYTFRVVDVHGHISNPSPIYQIEMIDQEGMIYPLLEVIDVDQPPSKKTTKSFRKYIKITPSLPQELLNESKSAIQDADSAKKVGDIYLGIRDQSTWDKQFKIRLISKSTGRKIDFNIDFNVKNLKRVESKDQK
jgi:hypothetical protein